MFANKPAFALFLLGAGGLLGVQQESTVAAKPVAPRANAAATALPSPDAVRTALDALLEARIQSDLDDTGARLAIGELALERDSLRSVQARGQGVVQVLGSRAIPVEVVATYDLIDGRLAHADYTAHAVEADLSPVDRIVRAAIGQRIGERIAGEFSGQRVQFQLLEVSRVGYGKHRTRLQGAGLTDFGAEGVAYTPFEAILDKHTGELLELEYDLQQEPEAARPLVGL